MQYHAPGFLCHCIGYGIWDMEYDIWDMRSQDMGRGEYWHMCQYSPRPISRNLSHSRRAVLGVCVRECTVMKFPTPRPCRLLVSGDDERWHHNRIGASPRHNKMGPGRGAYIHGKECLFSQTDLYCYRFIKLYVPLECVGLAGTAMSLHRAL